jgi:hypothetical protein
MPIIENKIMGLLSLNFQTIGIVILYLFITSPTYLTYFAGGCISTVCVNPDYWTESDTVLTLGHILQAFLGYEALPTDINSGIIELDYEMDAIS